MSGEPSHPFADWCTSFCDCGCRTVRFHAEDAEGRPILTLTFTADQAAEVGRTLLSVASKAAPDLAEQSTAALH